MTNQHLIFTIICITVSILLIAIVALYKSRRKQESLNAEIKRMANLKEQTAYMIIHDLKVPLATLSNIELISDAELQKKMVKQASKRMLMLVQNVLDVYKYEQTNIKLKKEAVELNNLIEECIAEFKIMSEIKKLSFKTSFLSKETIVADKAVMIRVISNILSNAIKFSPSNGVIDISTSTSDQYEEIKFKNQGPGIPKQNQSIIFERFKQTKDLDFSNISSTGLGLTFCKLAINAHKGDIGVNSDSDKGAEFWIRLPK